MSPSCGSGGAASSGLSILTGASLTISSAFSSCRHSWFAQGLHFTFRGYEANTQLSQRVAVHDI
jgi:hypothetical protein